MHRFRTITTVLFLTFVSAPLTAQEISAEKRTALAAVDAIAGEIAQIADTLWDLSELALREHESAEHLAAVLEREGFVVERGVAGMPTAFVATWGEGRPVIGILAEYDALPGIGNAPVPREEPRADGITAGQGCGHNLFGAGSVGAAIALERTMEAHGLTGTVKLFGTPAEETGVGKTYMARDGVFDGLDAVLEWHPSIETKVGNSANHALNNFTVEFFGRAAHGAYDPWNGKSALDAVELMAHGVNLMREHVPPTARIHYVIADGGGAPNVVPAYAKLWFFVRDENRPAVEAHYEWMLKIAEGAALATRTAHTVTLITGLHEYLYNRPLQEAMQRNLELVGPPTFDPELQSFARALQEELDIEPLGMDTTIQPLAKGIEPLEGGSTDVAEVSFLTPTAGLAVATAGRNLPWHSWATAASHGLPGASVSAEIAAKVIALTGVDLLTDPALVAQAKATFEELTRDRPYRSPLPAGQMVPEPEE
jgi:aminobenzoyl-glutamate utilization protein B